MSREAISNPWPVVKSENITILNPEAPIAVATLWTIKEKVAEGLDPSRVAVVGQLYEKHGVNLMLRNMLANKHMRHLVVAGSDLSGSGDALVRLHRDGVNGKYQIPGVEKASVQPDIPKEAIERWRENVILHDLRDPENPKKPANPDQVRGYIADLTILPPWGEPEVYEPPKIAMAEIFPSEPGAHIVRGRTIGETYLKVLNEIMKFGKDDGTNYGNTARDLTDLVTVVTDEDPDHPQVEEYFNFTAAEIAEYYDEFMSPERGDGFYRYGERIWAYPHVNGPINQAEIMVRKIKKDPNDRGVVAILYDPYRDNQLDKEPEDRLENGFRNPCLVFIQAEVKDDQLNLAGFFRSNDMYGAWPRNAFGMRRFQQYLAQETGYKMGFLATTSVRAHNYTEAWEPANSILKNYGSRIHGFQEDYRGNYTIRVDNQDKKIFIMHQPPTSIGGEPLRPEMEFDGQRKDAAIAVGNELLRNDGILLPAHGIHIGRELQQAEIATKFGLPYRQEKQDTMDAIAAAVEKARKYDELVARGVITQ